MFKEVLTITIDPPRKDLLEYFVSHGSLLESLFCKNRKLSTENLLNSSPDDFPFQCVQAIKRVFRKEGEWDGFGYSDYPRRNERAHNFKSVVLRRSISSNTATA